jgi:outer membrane biosynthesis protein TonB
MTAQEERKKRITAALTTLGVNVVVFLILFFAAAWKSAGSGEGQYPGIEVNLGYDDQGSGDDQPDRPIGNEEATDDENPPAQPAEEEPELETPQQAPVEELPETKIVQPTTVTDPNSDVEIPEEKKEVKPVEKPVEKKPVEKPIEQKPIEKPKVVDKNAVYPGKTTSANSTTGGTGTGKQGTSGNEGDDIGKQGDKGVEGGTVGAQTYQGRPGGGDGGTLDLYGWEWDNIPKPNITDNETGRVVFEIEVDENGDLLGYRKESGSVSAAAERACIAAIQKLTFSKKSGAKVPPVSKGRITFVIRAQ